MRLQPDGVNLLDTVIVLLRDEVLPATPAAQQYALRMAINAIGIARRQLQRGERDEAGERTLLAQLLAAEGSHAELSRLLAQRVRDGKVKADADLRRLLWQMTLQRVQESAPRYLEQEGLSSLMADRPFSAGTAVQDWHKKP